MKIKAAQIKDLPAQGGSGNRWYTGNALTGTPSSAVYSGSGIAAACVGDMYLNINTAFVYSCILAGAPSVARWKYQCCIKGIPGQGQDGDPGSIWYEGTEITGTSTASLVFSSSGITYARCNDMYLNTSNGNVYMCDLSGTPYAAKWRYLMSLTFTVQNVGGGGGGGLQGQCFTAHINDSVVEVGGDTLGVAALSLGADGNGNAVASHNLYSVSADLTIAVSPFSEHYQRQRMLLVNTGDRELQLNVVNADDSQHILFTEYAGGYTLQPMTAVELNFITVGEDYAEFSDNIYKMGKMFSSFDVDSKAKVFTTCTIESNDFSFAEKYEQKK